MIGSLRGMIVDNMIFASEVCAVMLIAPFDKISRPPYLTIRFFVFLSLFFRCFPPFSLYHRTSLLSIITMTYERHLGHCVLSLFLSRIVAVYSCPNGHSHHAFFLLPVVTSYGVTSPFFVGCHSLARRGFKVARSLKPRITF